ncbi:MAG: phytase [Acidobacteria bacterium]|nr:phytase [Acidobacteriota bacterium]
MTANERASRHLGSWLRWIRPWAASLALGVGLAGCAATTETGGPATPAPEASAPRQAVVAEAYESPRLNGDNVDSLAVWAPGGWLLATAKASDSVVVLDVASGAVVRRLGGSGSGPGQFRRPNGIAVVDDLLVVVERDNRRVQVIALPELTTVAIVGAGVLRFPYGVAAYASGAGRYELYVTDSYQQPDESVPPEAELGERVKHFRVEREGAALHTTLVRSFGATSGAGVLHVVESIAADPAAGRLLVADEADGRHDIKVYSLDGEFTGQVFGHGLFQADPEGIALVECGEGGFWVTTDQQKERTVFYLLDRRTFAVRGSFNGNVVANTDGIVTATGPVKGFPAGAVFAVHDDVSVAAFAWPAIAEKLGLPAPCRTSF